LVRDIIVIPVREPL